MGKKITANKKRTVGERQNWRCCLCGVRVIARGLDDTTDYARQNGYPPLIDGVINPITRQRRSNVFRISGTGSNATDNLAMACTWCITSKGKMSMNAWAHNVELMVLAGTHPCHKPVGEKNYLTYKPRRPWRPSAKRKRRPMYAHSEMI